MDKTSGRVLGADIQKLVTIHRNATRQLHLIDMQLESLTKKVFNAQVNGDRGLMLRLLARKSVLNGVRRVFNQFIQNKVRQIMELSTLTAEEPDISTIVDITSPVSGHVSTSDELVPNITETSILFSRCS
ncbi:uncharacterized protein LOC117328740 [Pecten maximus]|uniref:uncharacterized protein LOC117328740 n=1 Tax=Pecten maximus TaxID=6579 RepID=UPI001458B24C|nr:uncharacterized protein LOC117328740 [Pecten maximus]